MKTRTLVFVTAALFSALACGVARADNFTFSFSSDPTLSTVSGTVTGEIFGLPDNGTGAATDIVVTSYPAGLVSFGSYPTPVDIFTWTGGLTGENSFTVTNGVITGGGYWIDEANGDDDQLYLSAGIGYANGTNFFDIGSNDTLYVWNNNGIGTNGVSYSLASTPEPGSLLLLGSGLLSLAGRLRRKVKA
jgi:hypothetical protein